MAKMRNYMAGADHTQINHSEALRYKDEESDIRMPDQDSRPAGVFPEPNSFISLGKYLLAAAAGAAIALYATSGQKSVVTQSFETKKAFLQELERNGYNSTSADSDDVLITNYFCEHAPYSPSASTIADLKTTSAGRLILDIRHTAYISIRKCDRAFVNPGVSSEEKWRGGTTIDQDKADWEDPGKLEHIAAKYPIEIKDEYADYVNSMKTREERDKKAREYIRLGLYKTKSQ